MARFTRMQTLSRMYETGVVPVFYHPDIDTAKHVLEALAAGGCGLAEFTNRGDHAWEVFTRLESFCAEQLPDMVLGVGSVVDAPTAALYVNCGANFVVGQVLNREVADFCNRRKVPYSPGCASPSEISEAEALGCEIVKIFPAGQLGGPAFVKAMRGPCPWTSIMPTGGVEPTEQSLLAWFEAGVACVCMGSKPITKSFVAAGDWQGITDAVEKVKTIIRRVRTGQ